MKKKTVDYYMSLPYRMEIVPDTEGGGYAVSFPDLPGCVTCAETVEKSLGISTSTACRIIRKMIGNGIISADGNGKNAKYYLK